MGAVYKSQQGGAEFMAGFDSEREHFGAEGSEGREFVPGTEVYPYYEWLETVMEELAKSEVRAISLEVVHENGEVSTQYWNCNRGDRALMMAAMEEAQVMETLMDNRDVLLAILEGDDEEDEDGC